MRWLSGLRDLGLLEASLAQPRQSFAGVDPYPGLTAKAAALGFSLIQNHPFVDGGTSASAMPPWRPPWCSMDLSSASVEAAEAAVLANQQSLDSL
jgi:death-on-curing protein